MASFDVDPDVVLVEHRGGDGVAVLALSGELTLRTAAPLRRALSKTLLDSGRVALDLSGLRVGWLPAAHLFGSVLTDAGGWPVARLAAFGADPVLAGQFRSLRIPETVPLAADLDGARGLLDVRPAQVGRRAELPRAATAPRLARALVEWACADWDVDAVVATLVASELVSDAVEHGRSSCRLTLTLARGTLHVSVRDRRGPRPDTLTGPGRQIVAGVSRAWGVSRHADGRTGWAALAAPSAGGAG
ncbi:MAG: hypothetical protein ACT4RN_16390, partial [Pseudonocardia sp.]